MSKRQYFIVWNEARNEGFITDDERDAQAVLTGVRYFDEGLECVSAAGDDFRHVYDDEELSLERVEL